MFFNAISKFKSRLKKHSKNIFFYIYKDNILFKNILVKDASFFIWVLIIKENSGKLIYVLNIILIK